MLATNYQVDYRKRGGNLKYTQQRLVSLAMTDLQKVLCFVDLCITFYNAYEIIAENFFVVSVCFMYCTWTKSLHENKNNLRLFSSWNVCQGCKSDVVWDEQKVRQTCDRTKPVCPALKAWEI